MSFRDIIGTARTTLRSVIALLAQRSTSRVDGLLAAAGLAISATATKFKTTTQVIASYKGVAVVKAATDLLTFTAAHTVTKVKFGIILVQIDPATGTISTKVPAAPQAYASAALALAALPAADAGKVALGYITIDASGLAADWVANTDVLTTIAGFHSTAAIA